MQKSLGDADFRKLFESAPQLYLVLTPDLEILAASDAYLHATMTKRDQIVGRNIFEAFPENPADKNHDGHINVKNSLDIVKMTHRAHTLAVQKYDIRRPEEAGGGYEERYWSPVNSPVLDDDGKLLFIIHRVDDLTKFVKAKQKLSETELVNETIDWLTNTSESEVYIRAQEIQADKIKLAQLNAELTEARDEALELTKLKSDFLANMSHEIRTPMNGILGMADILLRHDLPPNLKEYVATIKEAGHSMLSVINGILDLSKIEAGKLLLEEASFDPVRLIEGVAVLLSEYGRSKNVTLVSFVDPAIPPKLMGDYGRLRQIIINLTGNAIKFSENTEVAMKADLLEASATDALLRFSVTDNGIGLTKAEIEGLFQPFVQAESAVSQKYGGTGLGLSISKLLAELMNGEMGVTSTKGKGSTFWFTVRLKLEDNVSSARTEDINQLNISNLNGAKILLIDDKKHSSESLNQYLLSWGMETILTDNGRQGLNLLKSAAAEQKPFKIVLVDLLMPGMNGVDLVRLIRAEPAISDTKIVVMMSSERQGMPEQARALGFDASVIKPVRQSHLHNCLNTLLLDMEKLKKEINERQVKLIGADDKSDYSATVSIKPPILVVEDHRINQQVAVLILKSLGLEAEVAETGQAAVDKLALKKYSLVFMDIQMPIMNGYEATQSIREQEKESGAHIPIIAMTAHVTENSREECLKAGMDEYLTKPISPDMIQKILDKWLPK